VTDDFKELTSACGDFVISPAHGIAAIALQMAMKYHDMSMIKDGAMYQQYKLEGRNITNIDLSDVFETAIQIEAHLLASSERVAEIIVGALMIPEDEEEAEVPA